MPTDINDPIPSGLVFPNDPGGDRGLFATAGGFVPTGGGDYGAYVGAGNRLQRLGLSSANIEDRRLNPGQPNVQNVLGVLANLLGVQLPFPNRPRPPMARELAPAEGFEIRRSESFTAASPPRKVDPPPPAALQRAAGLFDIDRNDTTAVDAMTIRSDAARRAYRPTREPDGLRLLRETMASRDSAAADEDDSAPPSAPPVSDRPRSERWYAQ
jgi:hypothetical protein